ncbi:hypothetical protein HJC23_000218 [Cyclotella cryptica]|uniref:Uncharacterized protein n=1 Tax=Cyclotella cryptica TaxID=29204 RepID=A0ABD3PLF8_9STRA|eukprot:CCRYP_013393-RD/>CCRYP_013393-RD protein AED:0.29 eAED:0.29 QI:884/1/1/1/0.66/0.5/4/267/383
MPSTNPTIRRTTLTSFAAGVLCVVCCQYSNVSSVQAFTLPAGSTRSVGSISSSSAALSSNKDNLFFATVVDEKEESNPKVATQEGGGGGETRKGVQLFSEETLREANDALTSVGWSGVAPASTSTLNISEDEMGELTSDDPFVKEINESIQREMGVGLDELLNPAKVVNLERDLYNLRNELATLTNAAIDTSLPLVSQTYDAGGGGETADTIRVKISKKEKDLALERRSVFRGWLKNVFLGQAILSMALSYVMATNPDAIFGSFDWYNNISNMDTSISVLGFWWWWLFIVPSLRSRRPTGKEKKALDMAFLGTPLISLLSPVVTKDTGLIWLANFVVVAGSYGFAFLVEDEEEGEDGGDQPGWLKFIYKSLDFGSGRERGARK